MGLYLQLLDNVLIDLVAGPYAATLGVAHRLALQGGNHAAGFRKDQAARRVVPGGEAVFEKQVQAAAGYIA